MIDGINLFVKSPTRRLVSELPKSTSKGLSRYRHLCYPTVQYRPHTQLFS